MPPTHIQGHDAHGSLPSERREGHLRRSTARKTADKQVQGTYHASYKTPLGLWQFDATLQLNGGGRMPDPYELPDGTMSWNKRFGSYEQLSAQITRWFRHWSVYVGGENLTGFTQKTSIYGADESMGHGLRAYTCMGPVHGRMFYAGVRINIGRM